MNSPRWPHTAGSSRLSSVPPHLPLQPRSMAVLALALSLLGIVGCADAPLRLAQPSQTLRDELRPRSNAHANANEAATSPAADAAPQAAGMTAGSTAGSTIGALSPQPPASPPAAPPEPRFDLVVNGAQVRDVFLSLVADTRYSMLVHPSISGQLSVTLKGVTVREALESIRDVYGYDFQIEGRRITVFPPTMQTRVYSVNYLHGLRQGRSEVRISASAAPQASTSQGTAANNNASGGSSGNSGNPQVQHDSSKVSTTSSHDFWSELSTALRSLVGNESGRSVVASPLSGTVAVRAMPDELRHVESFLKSARLVIERQVMLEAKIVEVELREGYQSGIDWSLVGRYGAVGQTGVNPSVPAGGVSGTTNPLVSNNRGLPVLSTGNQSPAWSDLIPLPSSGSGTLGLALSRGGFQALLGFLESQGDTQILSSPRIATLNNQKAVLKVGTDDYFVTGISGGTTNTGTNNSTTPQVSMPTLTLTPFFSGIALDVTPQIDDEGMITLHVHPSVTQVTERVKQVDMGSVGNYRLPLASSSVNETDTVVRIPDGHIVAIGGLMQEESTRRGSGLPGTSGNSVLSTLFGNRASNGRKRELVVLIKPSIIRTAQDWERQTERTHRMLDEMDESRRRVIRLDGPAQNATNAGAETRKGP